MDDESCSDEDDDEDDIPRGRWSASCHAWLPVSNHSLKKILLVAAKMGQVR